MYIKEKMETHDHHSPFAVDIHLSSIASVFPQDQLPAAIIDAGPGTAIWYEEQGKLSPPQGPGLFRWDIYSPKAVPALRGLTAQEEGLMVTLLNLGCCFQFAFTGLDCENAALLQYFYRSHPCSFPGLAFLGMHREASA